MYDFFLHFLMCCYFIISIFVVLYFHFISIKLLQYRVLTRTMRSSTHLLFPKWGLKVTFVVALGSATTYPWIFTLQDHRRFLKHLKRCTPSPWLLIKVEWTSGKILIQFSISFLFMYLHHLYVVQHCVIDIVWVIFFFFFCHFCSCCGLGCPNVFFCPDLSSFLVIKLCKFPQF